MKKPQQAISELRTGTPYRAALLLALFMFLFIFTVTSVFARSMQEQNNRDFNGRVKNQATSLQSELSSKTARYRQLLLHASSLFAVKADISRADWKTFYETSDLAATYPAIIGIAYAPIMNRDEVEGFRETQQAIDGTDITIAPTTERATVAPILYIEPYNSINRPVIGFDMSSDPIRRAAMEQSRDNAEAVMTAPVDLVQDKDKPKREKGVLIYYPVFSGKEIPSSLEERRAQVRGYVYAVLHPGDLVKSYLDKNKSDYDQTAVRVEDVTDAAHVTNVFATSPQPTPRGPATTDREVGEISGRSWAVSTTGWNTVVQRSSPFVVFVLGTVVSLLLSWMIYRVMMGRMKHIASAYEGEVQRTKDELLALASHQLRTPASGVKQYLGMLTSGIFGELSHNQLSIAEKAYEANERQLEIINELLYVSKADAGQLVIEPKTFDFTRVVQRSADGMAEQAATKDITIHFATKRVYRVTADDRYISMAVDNLISNAVKYSYPSSTVYLKITSNRDEVMLTVRDKGVGIDEDDLEHIFGKFNRADNPLSHSEGGSGLGLFLARQLARAHGGDIEVESVIEKGSTFTLILPKTLTINEAIVNLDRIKRNEGKR